MADRAIANATTATVVKLYGDDVELSDNYTVKVAQTYITKPVIADSKIGSWFTVRDILNITQDSSLNLTDVKCNVSYPSHRLSEPVSTYEFGTLNTNEYKEGYIDYQKYGPYVTDIYKSTSNNTVTITMKVYSYENLTDVSFEFDPFEEPWSKYFEDFSYDTMKRVELNGVNVTWYKGSILLKNLTVNKGYNDLKVVYARAVAPPPTIVATPAPWYEPLTQVYVLPVWAWLLIAVIVVLAVIHCRRMRR